MKKNEMTGVEFQTYISITDEQYKALEVEHGKLKIIEVPLMDEDDEDYNEDKVASFILKCNPKRAILKSIQYEANKQHPNFDKIEDLGKKEVLLGGDMIYLDTDKGEHAVFMAVNNAVGEIIKGRKATLGKRVAKKR